MASLGNVGKFYPHGGNYSALQFFTLDKQPTSVIMSGISAINNSYAILTRNAVLNYRTRSDSSGNWHFYDMDDSGSQVYSIATYTQAGATGEAWSATVVGSVATVTKTFAANRAAAAAFT